MIYALLSHNFAVRISALFQQIFGDFFTFRMFDIKFLHGDATSLSFPDSTFGLVASRLAIHHFTKPKLILDEMARVTAPGGRVVLVDLVASECEDQVRLGIPVITVRRQKTTTDWKGCETLPTLALFPSLTSLLLWVSLVSY